MADIADQSQDWIDREIELRLNAQAAKPPLDPGTPGDCDYCGEPTPRLINRACAPCREHYRLP